MNLKLDPLPLIYSQTPWEDRFQQAVQPLGFGDGKKAWNMLLTLAKPLDFPGLFPGFFPLLLQQLSQSYDADLALRNFERFAGKIFDQNYFYTLLEKNTDLLHALVTLFSGSQVLTDTLLKDPAHFDGLKNPDVLNQSRSKDSLMRDFYEMAGDDPSAAAVPSLLRRFKKREYIRIGLRDLLGKAAMLETVRDLSHLADVCLQIAYEHADNECRDKYGVPMYQDPEGNWLESEFTILGMGKLGGQELNFSSDIDLIYIYTSSMGETRPEHSREDACVCISNHEYFTKLAQKLTRTIHDITPDGNVFRVDLDLRPEGRSGEIANSLASCEVYYQSWGRTWERQALLKARVCAGSIALGKEFFQLLEPFIYRRNLDFSAIEEIKAMKEKINASLKGKKSGKGNIKLGFGGIREIEFIVQAYLLLFGGRQPGLRLKNTLRLMAKLRDAEFLSTQDHDDLKAAYIFLRNLENRVQISFGLQTHVLPEDKQKLAVLARKMGLTGKTEEALGLTLMQQFEAHTHRVGEMFSGLFVDEKKREAEQKVQGDKGAAALRMELSEPLLDQRGFPDPSQALRFLQSLRDGAQFSHPSEKSIQDFYACLPVILDHCERVPKPNAAVENLVKFVEASRARDSYLNLFLSHEKILELFCTLFGSSDYLSNTLVKQPGLVDVLMDLEAIYRYKPPEKIAEDLKKNLRGVEDFQASKNALRRFKQGEELRIGLRFLIRESDLAGTLGDLSALAEVYLNTATELAFKELKNRSEDPASLPKDFAVFGLGKLGGSELNFGSDLDIVYVFDETQAADFPKEKRMDHYVAWCQLIHQLTAERTDAGIAYELDTDLRPDGSRGTLAHSIKGYEDYFASRARIWERQAMIRLRFVAGDRELGAKFLKTAHGFTYGKKLDYGSLIEISRLRERMEKELAQESRKGKNVKLGFGGIVDIEFAMQIMQLMHGRQNPGLRLTPTLDVLKQLGGYGMLDQQEVDQVQKDYLFLRTLECALRILNDPSTNHLPKDTESLVSLGKLLGYAASDTSGIAEQVVADYDATTKRVRAFYRKLIDKLLRTAL